jgi:hypothetical protein
MSRDATLRTCLEFAVPLWIAKLARQPIAHVRARAGACDDALSDACDATSFNTLAEALACLSFRPGGVRYLGLHFEARHPEAA